MAVVRGMRGRIQGNEGTGGTMTDREYIRILETQNKLMIELLSDALMALWDLGACNYRTPAFFQRMKIYVHAQVYQRIKDVAKSQCRTKSDLVQDALVRFLGMEGMPLDDEIVYGRDDGKENKE
jgi:hypothetical protein